ncbi:MAG: hypothetical protein NTX71_00880 [Candidatus Aureabacteria bacterium]|nr:hypothetical protein [Candidatus Auribacterota bacterium]
MKDIRMLFISIGLLISLALTSCNIFKHGTEFTTLVLHNNRYWIENNRWPNNEEELRAFTERKGLNFDWSKFSKVKLTPQTDGSLFLEAEYAPPESGRWSATIKAPKETKKAGRNTR